MLRFYHDDIRKCIFMIHKVLLLFLIFSCKSKDSAIKSALSINVASKMTGGFQTFKAVSIYFDSLYSGDIKNSVTGRSIEAKNLSDEFLTADQQLKFRNKLNDYLQKEEIRQRKLSAADEANNIFALEELIKLEINEMIEIIKSLLLKEVNLNKFYPNDQFANLIKLNRLNNQSYMISGDGKVFIDNLPEYIKFGNLNEQEIENLLKKEKNNYYNSLKNRYIQNDRILSDVLKNDINNTRKQLDNIKYFLESNPNNQSLGLTESHVKDLKSMINSLSKEKLQKIVLMFILLNASNNPVDVFDEKKDDFEKLDYEIDNSSVKYQIFDGYKYIRRVSDNRLVENIKSSFFKKEEIKEVQRYLNKFILKNIQEDGEYGKNTAYSVILAKKYFKLTYDTNSPANIKVQKLKENPYLDLNNKEYSNMVSGFVITDKLFNKIKSEALKIGPNSNNSSRYTIVKLAEEFIGYPYWWGKSRLPKNMRKTATCGKKFGKDGYGADCSGYVTRIWGLASVALDKYLSPNIYTTETFHNRQIKWRHLSNLNSLRQADAAVVRRSNNTGHIVLICGEKRRSDGGFLVCEARGCDYGIVKRAKRLDIENYKPIRLSTL